MAIKKRVEIKVLNKIANVAFIKEYRDEADVYVYDLAESIEDEEGNISYNYLAIDRYSRVDESPFELTEEEFERLTEGKDE